MIGKKMVIKQLGFQKKKMSQGMKSRKSLVFFVCNRQVTSSHIIDLAQFWRREGSSLPSAPEGSYRIYESEDSKPYVIGEDALLEGPMEGQR